jgi:hypothetical protein
MAETTTLRIRLVDTKAVMWLASCGRHAARDLMYRAGAVKLGRSLRVRVEDLDRIIAELAEESRTG